MDAKVSQTIKTFIAFSIAVFVMLFYNYVEYGAIYIPSHDGELYLSVAENFLNNGRFVQTSRPYEMDMIVPPGLPLILTLLLSVSRSYLLIIFLQYILYGMTAALLYRISVKLCPFGEKILCITIPATFVIMSFHADAPNPAMVLTETYTTFALALTLYILLVIKTTTSNKCLFSCAVLFVQFLIRPATAGLLILGIGVMIVQMVNKRISAPKVVLSFLVAVAVLCMNISNNYKETGKWILTENYSAIPIYLANNSETKTTPYSSAQLEQFSDEYFLDIYFDEELTTQDKNELLSSKTTAFIAENLLFVIKNAAIKFYRLFVAEWGSAFWVFWVSLVCFTWNKRLEKNETLLLITGFLILTIVTSFGLVILRYATPIIPFYVAINNAFYIELFISCAHKVRKNR